MKVTACARSNPGSLEKNKLCLTLLVVLPLGLLNSCPLHGWKNVKNRSAQGRAIVLVLTGLLDAGACLVF